jgi:hypothetical protein
MRQGKTDMMLCVQVARQAQDVSPEKAEVCRCAVAAHVQDALGPLMELHTVLVVAGHFIQAAAALCGVITCQVQLALCMRCRQGKACRCAQTTHMCCVCEMRSAHV